MCTLVKREKKGSLRRFVVSGYANVDLDPVLERFVYLC